MQFAHVAGRLTVVKLALTAGTRATLKIALAYPRLHGELLGITPQEFSPDLRR